ncbi:two-component sensor histidine kinase [Sphaerisporangium melleum]|uniref:histidine kinase n=1 Tax=Sphaerisporangium melleum TaxID=321316 RepID=A0A917RLR4_9ACTN|nr:ATP-binding protein [Sphaerisporangium melleum]GGL13965.1 two-component sensor histidine kinase [Sphaerisporangium melleum]GII74606.1 two-component sensor histidine kinase [Sphaerisporangium melleum]
MDGIVARAARGALNVSSLRWKIAALVAVASCSVAVVIGVLVHRSTFDRSLTLGRERATSALISAVDDYHNGRSSTGGKIATPDQIPPALARRAGRTWEIITWYDDRKPGVPWMWAAVRVDDRVLAVQVDMGTDLRSLIALDRHIVLASLAALGVVVPLAALAAELPNRRLRRVARTARRIAAGDLDARTGDPATRRSGGHPHTGDALHHGQGSVPSGAYTHPGGQPNVRDDGYANVRGGGHAGAAGTAIPIGRRGDEISEISATVDLMADSLRDRLLSERRFTADVAHELRTPLMGLVTAAGLLPESEATELVQDRVRVLRTLVENLLEISRLDAGVERADLAPVPLGEIVAESAARTGLPARITTDDPATVLTDPRRLDRIIANLVINAHRHGRAPVEVTVTGTSVVVRDHGPGFPVSVLDGGPQRFHTGAAERGTGHGLGLTIALGQARVIGTELTLANAPDGGAIATLRHLPAVDFLVGGAAGAGGGGAERIAVGWGVGGGEDEPDGAAGGVPEVAPAPRQGADQGDAAP